MIIVSQDKDTIVNFDNVVSVYVIKDTLSAEKRLENYNIDYSTNDEINIVIGTYATEERAKEVLREIIEKTKNKSTLAMDAIEIKTEISDGIYEMPKE